MPWCDNNLPTITEDIEEAHYLTDTLTYPSAWTLSGVSVIVRDVTNSIVVNNNVTLIGSTTSGTQTTAVAQYLIPAGTLKLGSYLLQFKWSFENGTDATITNDTRQLNIVPVGCA